MQEGVEQTREIDLRLREEVGEDPGDLEDAEEGVFLTVFREGKTTVVVMSFIRPQFAEGGHRSGDPGREGPEGAREGPRHGA